MPWNYANAEQTIVSDGNEAIPINQPTERSRWLNDAIAAGLVIGPYVPPAPAPPAYTPDQLQALLIQKGIIPPPTATN